MNNLLKFRPERNRRTRGIKNAIKWGYVQRKAREGHVQRKVI